MPVTSGSGAITQSLCAGCSRPCAAPWSSPALRSPPPSGPGGASSARARSAESSPLTAVTQAATTRRAARVALSGASQSSPASVIASAAAGPMLTGTPSTAAAIGSGTVCGHAGDPPESVSLIALPVPSATRASS